MSRLENTSSYNFSFPAKNNYICNLVAKMQQSLSCSYEGPVHHNTSDIQYIQKHPEIFLSL